MYKPIAPTLFVFSPFFLFLSPRILVLQNHQIFPDLFTLVPTLVGWTWFYIDLQTHPVGFLDKASGSVSFISFHTRISFNPSLSLVWSNRLTPFDADRLLKGNQFIRNWPKWRQDPVYVDLLRILLFSIYCQVCSTCLCSSNLFMFLSIYTNLNSYKCICQSKVTINQKDTSRFMTSRKIDSSPKIHFVFSVRK